MSRYRPGTYIALFIGAHFAHHLLTALVVPLLPYIRSGFELNYAQSGVIVSAFTLSYGIGQLPAGRLADRLGRTHLITAGIAGLALAGVVAGLTTSYYALIGALIFMGIAGGGYHPSAAPLITASVPPQRRGRALGLHLVGGSASHFVTPLLGASLAAIIGWRGAFLGIAGPVFVFGIVFFLIIRSRGEQRWEADEGDATDVFAATDVVDQGDVFAATHAVHQGDATGARHGTAPVHTEQAGPGAERRRARRRTVVRVSVFLILTSAVGAAISSFTAFMPLYLVDVFSLSEELAAGALSIFFVTGVVAAPIGGELSDRFGPVPVLITLSIAAGPLLLFAAWAPSALIFLAAIVVVGVATFVRMPVSESYLSADVPERLRSTVLGVYFFAGMEASGVLTPVLGYLIDRQGFPVAFTVFGAVLTIVAIVSAIALQAVRRW